MSDSSKKRKGDKYYHGSLKKSKNDKDERKEEPQNSLSEVLGSPSRIIIKNKREGAKSDDSVDGSESFGYELALEHDRSLSKQEYQKQKAQNQWVNELVQQQVFLESADYGNCCQCFCINLPSLSNPSPCCKKIVKYMAPYNFCETKNDFQSVVPA